MKAPEKINSRREFLANTTKAGLVVGMVGTGILASSCAAAKGTSAGIFLTGFAQTPLAYDYTALQPHIDAKTMEIHYTKHAAAYASNLVDAAKEEGVDTSKPLENVLANISNYSVKMRNNGGGHYNHELFWSIMAPNAGGKPQGKLMNAITSSFGSYDNFVSQFETAAKTRFGSGWAWLVVQSGSKLVVSSTPNQDNPLMDLAEVKGIPILGLDVWEHAYYLNYQNRRPDYVSAFWKLVNWGAVAERFEKSV
ncbi:superoxide dismutase [Algoriphagus sp.]|jgi:Fe-Mn family superoxide dismutase|uniref:superoxide dismutase n=1 Tax=Algoriphagus sp. TaxID=1872435 RepID=UPI0027280C6E|nr:superoxide dismutase [Algoriphagus sp.]MDO8966541.1 superoxide dismutase [Algoriphagus sp.]MDP3201987.1 superoxide dismutase [Algoriphagus sp.]